MLLDRFRWSGLEITEAGLSRAEDAGSGAFDPSGPLDTSDLPAACLAGHPCTGEVTSSAPGRIVVTAGGTPAGAGEGSAAVTLHPNNPGALPLTIQLIGDSGEIIASTQHTVTVDAPITLDLSPHLDFGAIPAGTPPLSPTSCVSLGRCTGLGSCGCALRGSEARSCYIAGELTHRSVSMRRRRILAALTVLAIGSLACSGLEELSSSGGGGDYYMTAELTEPWSSMGLPIDGGNVFLSTPDAVTLQYNDGALADHYSRYRTFFESSGHEIIVEDVTGPTMTVVYRKGDQYALSGIDVAGQATITIGRSEL
ncbi:MAG: hypothetical protein ACI8S6_004840 [Myxococcota bacterium]